MDNCARRFLESTQFVVSSRQGWAGWLWTTDKQCQGGIPRQSPGAGIVPGSLVAAAAGHSHATHPCLAPCSRRSSISSRKQAPAAASKATSKRKESCFPCLLGCLFWALFFSFSPCLFRLIGRM
jgi:hypothetical protein